MFTDTHKSHNEKSKYYSLNCFPYKVCAPERIVGWDWIYKYDTLDPSHDTLMDDRALIDPATRMKSSTWICQVGDGDATTIDPSVPATCAIPVCPFCGDSRAFHTRECLPAERPMCSGHLVHSFSDSRIGLNRYAG